MRRFRRSERGLSEIVGTLMLVVIVVSAATLLAAFVASYQRQLQSEETMSHDQSLESIEILGLLTTVGGGQFTSFAFTLASEYVNPSGILDVYINGNPLLDFAWHNVTTGTYGTYNAVTSLNALTILPFDQVEISLCLVATCSTPGGPLTNSFLPGAAPLPNQYIKFDIFTHLHNDFQRDYLPPTPIPVVTETNPSGNNPLTLLDGSMSLQPGGNASIVNWAWSVTGAGLNTSTNNSITSVNVTGPFGNGTYSGIANATIQDPWGTLLLGSGYGVAFVGMPTADILDDGLGCATTSAYLGPITTQKIASDVLTVTYPYSVTIGSCTASGTIGFANSGGNVALAVNATGEEFELSPALPTLSGSETPYLATLVTTNSDGLDGAVTVSYSPPS